MTSAALYHAKRRAPLWPTGRGACIKRPIPLPTLAVWFDQRISVIVPCYREARLVGRMLSRIPAWVDHILAVDDGSDDGTADAILAVADPRIELHRHQENRGVGASIVSGYLRALERGSEVLVIMAGDDQMDPDDLPRLIQPILQGQADYVKGNRFLHRERYRMPRLRQIGGRILSWATRWATGFHIDDTQCGYTAMRSTAAMRLPLTSLWSRFGYPNDLLVMMAARGMNVSDVVVRPIYADERSGIRAWHLFVVLFVIVRRLLLERFAPVRSGQPVTQNAE